MYCRTEKTFRQMIVDSTSTVSFRLFHGIGKKVTEHGVVAELKD